MKPQLSIIIPVYNGQNYLQKCLQSVFASAYNSFEVIVVDDASKEDVASIAKKFSCRYIRNERRMGSGPSRNYGANIAKGKILVFLDSDCIVHTSWLSSIAQNFKKLKVGAVAGQYSGFVENSFISKFSFYELLFRERNFKKYVKTMPSCNFACKRDAFFDVGGFSEKGRYSDDLEFSYRFGKKYKILWDPKIHVRHHFPATFKKYLSKQFISSRDDVSLFIANPKMAFEDTFEDKMNYLEVIFTGVLLMSLFLLSSKPIFFTAFGLALFIIFLINIAFFRYLYLKEGLSFVFTSFIVLLMRNFIWLSGAFNGFVMYIGGRK
ncbi:glycosyltransferase family 2 protein [Candidatus Woesearchaeota archaeon]|nr:glycosyltransferase family 2 protein [Candidatus Woesearchaeota archaeon]